MVRTFEPNEVKSIHLSEYPKIDSKYINNEILVEVESIRKIIAMGLMLRNENQLKVKQPLSAIYIFTDNTKAITDFKEIILDELNIKNLSLLEDGTILEDEYFVVNFKVAGKLLKDRIQEFKEVIENLDTNETSELLKEFKNENINNINI